MHGKESLDSCYYGPVAVNLVEGVVVGRVWPLGRGWGLLFGGREGVDR